VSRGQGSGNLWLLHVWTEDNGITLLRFVINSKLIIPQFFKTDYCIFQVHNSEIPSQLWNTEAVMTGLDISHNKLLIRKKGIATCCKLMMNEYWDLGVTTFLSHITWYIIYWNFLKN
jgi:hypothetical protein